MQECGSVKNVRSYLPRGLHQHISEDLRFAKRIKECSNETSSLNTEVTYTFVAAVHATTHGPIREFTSTGHSTHFTTEDEAITRSAYFMTVTSHTDNPKDNVG